MQGDVIIVEDHHRRVAEIIVRGLVDEIRASNGRYTLTVAGESGSGKSETARAIADVLEAQDIATVVLQQDDYFVLPPKSNDARRREDIAWVGTQEVRLDRLDSHLVAALGGATSVDKPLVIYEEDRVVEETLEFGNAKVVIAEGTYTTLLEHAIRRVFIDRNRLETMAARERRGREAMDPFIERVLEIEHAIISAHKARADVVITRGYDVEM